MFEKDKIATGVDFQEYVSYAYRKYVSHVKCVGASVGISKFFFLVLLFFCCCNVTHDELHNANENEKG